MAFFVLGCYCCQCIPLLSCRYQLTLICDEKQSGRHTQAVAMLLSNGFCRMWPSLHSSSLMVAICFLDANSSDAECCDDCDEKPTWISGKVIGGLTALIAQSRCQVVSFFIIPVRSAMHCTAPSKSLSHPWCLLQESSCHVHLGVAGLHGWSRWYRFLLGDFDNGAVRPLGRVSTSGMEKAFGQSRMRTLPCLDEWGSRGSNVHAANHLPYAIHQTGLWPHETASCSRHPSHPKCQKKFKSD